MQNNRKSAPTLVHVSPDSARTFFELGRQIARVPESYYGPNLPHYVENCTVEPSPDQDPGLWLDMSGRALTQAAPAAWKDLAEAGERGAPALWVQGLLPDAIPPRTPDTGVVDWRAAKHGITNVMAVMAAMKLHPVCYAGENESILHAVVPTKAVGDQLSSRGFKRPLPWHTDYANRPLFGQELVADLSPAATHLAFAVIRGEPEVPMECVDLAKVTGQLTEKELALAMTEQFDAQAPEIFHSTAPATRRCLLHPDGQGGYLLRVNLGSMRGATPAAAALLECLRTILENDSLVTRFDVRPGDVVVFDNRRVVHRRSAFTPRFDGTDRFFIRVSATPSVEAGISPDAKKPWKWR